MCDFPGDLLRPCRPVNYVHCCNLTRRWEESRHEPNRGSRAQGQTGSVRKDTVHRCWAGINVPGGWFNMVHRINNNAHRLSIGWHDAPKGHCGQPGCGNVAKAPGAVNMMPMVVYQTSKSDTYTHTRVWAGRPRKRPVRSRHGFEPASAMWEIRENLIRITVFLCCEGTADRSHQYHSVSVPSFNTRSVIAGWTRTITTDAACSAIDLLTCDTGSPFPFVPATIDHCRNMWQAMVNSFQP